MPRYDITARWLEHGRAARARVDAARPHHATIDFGLSLLERDASIGGGLLAGALAYRLFVLLLPTALLFVSGLGLYADAAEAEQLVDPVPVHVGPLAGACQEGGHEVDPWLDCPHVAGLERDVAAEAWEAGRRLSQLVGCHAGVAYSQSDHVAHAVGEEEGDRSALEQRLGLASQHAQLDEALAGDQGGESENLEHAGGPPMAATM